MSTQLDFWDDDKQHRVFTYCCLHCGYEVRDIREPQARCEKCHRWAWQFAGDHALARHSDPITSHLAAADVHVNRAERLVVEAIRRAEPCGLIADQLPEKTGLRLNTASARTRPLCEKNLIYDSGMKRVSSSGSLQIVWRAVPKEKYA